MLYSTYLLIKKKTEWPFNGKILPCKDLKALTQRCHTAVQQSFTALLIKFIGETLFEMEESSDGAFNFMKSLV